MLPAVAISDLYVSYLQKSDRSLRYGVEREKERKELVVVAACIFARLSMPINTIFFARTHAHLIACSQPHLATQKPMSRGK